MKTMLRLLIFNLSLIAVLLLLNSCHHNLKDFVGPGVCPSSSFKVLSKFNINSPVYPDSINFNSDAQGVVMYAEYNETVYWTISIQGHSSGALKNYSGRSAIVDVHWRGEPGTNAVFFQAETVTITHYVSCQEPVSLDVIVSAANNFSTYGNSGQAVLLTDFDTPVHGSIGNTCIKGNNPGGWSGYYLAPNDFPEFAVVNGPLTPIQGNGYLHIKGQAGPSSWYCGGADASVNLTSLSSSIDNTYLNLMINSNGNSSTLLSVSLSTGLFPNATTYTQLVPLNWNGWKALSIKLSDLKTKRGTGLSNSDISLINNLDLGLNCASAMGQETEVNVDFIIFTVGEPFLGK